MFKFLGVGLLAMTLALVTNAQAQPKKPLPKPPVKAPVKAPEPPPPVKPAPPLKRGGPDFYFIGEAGPHRLEAQGYVLGSIDVDDFEFKNDAFFFNVTYFSGPKTNVRMDFYLDNVRIYGRFISSSDFVLKEKSQIKTRVELGKESKAKGITIKVSRELD